MATAINREPKYLTLGLPKWINKLENDQKRVLAAIGRIRRTRQTPTLAGMYDNMRDEVVTANLLFHCGDEHLLRMLMLAYDREHSIFAEG